MSKLKAIPIGIIIALTALGGTVGTVEITAKNSVDKIIADKVISAEEVLNTMAILRWENGDELERLKAHLLPLATEIKNNGHVEVLKLDELYALQSFGADVEIILEDGQDFSQAVYKYLENQLEPTYTPVIK